MFSSLKNQKEFDLVNKYGKKYFSPYFLVVISVNTPKLTYQTNHATAILGMKVGRKLGNAVVRNKIKRRTRHLVRTIFKSTATDCISIIVVPKKGFDKIPFSSLFKEFEKIYQLILGKKVDYSC